MVTSSERPRIKEVIVVEGRDDTAAILRAVEAVTIETHGFGMSQKMWEQIDTAYRTKGIIVFTDPDYAGEKIRRKIIEKYPDCKQAFLPQKEALKKKNIGVENARPQSIIEALEKARCTDERSPVVFSEEDLIEFGLVGREDSRKRREKVGAILGIGYGNAKALIKKLNSFGISREKFIEAVKDL